jgi:cytoskeleton protein RodZ
MDEETNVTETLSVGEQLRIAREEKGLSLDDIAGETRIPFRHLESLENGEWDKLPAPTYTIGFAKAYASVVGLDRAEISEHLRAEMGGYRNDTSTVEHFEPVDPARAMPRSLVIAAIVAILLIVLLFTFLRNRSLDENVDVPESAVAEQSQQQAAEPQAPATPARQAATANGPVVVTAIAPAWIRVTDQGRTLFEGMMNPGQTYQVPPTATAPMLRAGAPEALRITVGNTVAPPVGAPGAVTSNVSMLPADLMRSPEQPQQPAQNSLAQ